MAKRISISLFTLLSIFCIVYYTSKFYFEGELFFDNKMILAWTIIVVLIILSLSVGLFSVWKVYKLDKENLELKELVLQLNEHSENHYDSLCNYLLNSRELSLDIFDKVQGREQ